MRRLRLPSPEAQRGGARLLLRHCSSLPPALCPLLLPVHPLVPPAPPPAPPVPPALPVLLARPAPSCQEAAAHGRRAGLQVPGVPQWPGHMSGLALLVLSTPGCLPDPGRGRGRCAPGDRPWEAGAAPGPLGPSPLEPWPVPVWRGPCRGHRRPCPPPKCSLQAGPWKVVSAHLVHVPVAAVLGDEACASADHGPACPGPRSGLAVAVQEEPSVAVVGKSFSRRPRLMAQT